MKKDQKSIPTSKVKRATRFVRSGLKVGGNYIKHYSQKLVDPELDRAKLDQKNAQEIYGTLSELKGSALKVAQMLSMDQNVLPGAFIEKFTQAQYDAPALSGPLVVRTVRQHLGQSPNELFDEFDLQAVHAASMGQVHRAKKDGKALAVKIQYPGVGDSVVSDLNLVRPFARRMFGWKDRDLDQYFDEVKDRLLEETNYELELRRGQQISQQCAPLEGLAFPTYYPEWSSRRLLVMSWLEGQHLDDFLATRPDQATRDKLGQSLWDFYSFQIHHLRITHADAHPGNFLFRQDGTLGILDFGCVKEVPEDFYAPYAAILKPGIIKNEKALRDAAILGEMILEDDSPEEEAFFLDLLRNTIEILCRPFYREQFDFGEKAYLDEIYAYGESMARAPEIRKSRVPRGSKDGIYINRAYFGLYMILHKLGARVDTRRWLPEAEAKM